MARPFPLYLKQRSAKKFQIFPFILIQMRKKNNHPVKTSNIYLGKESYFQYSFNASATAESSRAKRVEMTSLGLGEPCCYRFSFLFCCLVPDSSTGHGHPSWAMGCCCISIGKNTMRGAGHKLDWVLLVVWAKRTSPRSHPGAKREGPQGAEPQLRHSPLRSDLVPCRHGQTNPRCQTKRPTNPLIDAQNPEGRFAVTLCWAVSGSLAKQPLVSPGQSRAVLFPADTVSMPQSPLVPFELLPPLNAAAWKTILKKS